VLGRNVNYNNINSFKTHLTVLLEPETNEIA